MTMRVMPPAGGAPTYITVNDRKYTCAMGSTLDVPDQDAFILAANGWTIVANGVGSTANRPARPLVGQDFHDTTLAKNIRFDGKTWRDPATGGAV